MSTAYLFNEADASFIPVQDGLVLGRNEGHLRFASDPLVSRSHCRFRIINQEFYVEDLASRNQTRVNRVALIPRQPRKILLNDVIRIGDQRLIFTSNPAGIPEGNVERTREISTRADLQKPQAPARRPLVRVRKTIPSAAANTKEIQRLENQMQLSSVTLTEPVWENKRIQARQARQIQQDTGRAKLEHRGARLKLWMGAILAVLATVFLLF